MVEPFSFCLAAAAGGVIEFFTGKACDQTVTGFAQILRQGKPELNHHIEKAIVQAHFQALGQVIGFSVTKLGMAQPGQADSVNANVSLNTLKQRAKEAYGKLTSDGKKIATDEGFASNVAELTKNWRAVTAATFTDDYGQFVMPEDYVKVAVEDLRGLTEWDPETWERIETAAKDAHYGWASLFQLALHDLLKKEPSPFRTALHSHWLNRINLSVDALADAMGEGIDRLREDVRRLRGELSKLSEKLASAHGEVMDALDTLHDKVDDIKDNLLTQLAEVRAEKAEAEGRLKTIEDERNELRGELSILQNRVELSEQQTLNFLKLAEKILARHDIPEAASLSDIFNLIKQGLGSGGTVVGSMTNIAADLSSLKEEIDQFLADFDIEAARRALNAERQKQRERFEAAAREDAFMTAEEARIEAADAKVAEAMSLYERAAYLMTPYDLDAAWAYLMNGASVGLNRSRVFAEKPIMDAAITLYRKALLMVSADNQTGSVTGPASGQELNWAATQNDLGNALQVIGERGDEAALGQAVEAYREALKERTRDKVPLDWAATQNNLGIALRVLGERGDELALGQAVEACRAALKELTRDKVPLDWATTQNNLGIVFCILGERGDEAALGQAVEAYREALKERTRDKVPLEWAATQNNLGAVLQVLGERGDEAALGKAVEAYDEALKEWTRDKVPLDWAMTQSNLGTALQVQGERGDEAALGQAVKAYREALKERTRDKVPLDWAMTQSNLGTALQVLGERGDELALSQAIEAYCEALKEQTRDKVPLQWASTQHGLGYALWLQGKHQAAEDCYREALAVFRAHHDRYALERLENAMRAHGLEP